MSNTHATHVTAPTTVVTTTETVAAVLNGFTPNNPQGQGVCLDGIINITAGTGTTSVTVKLYRAGSVAPVVGSAVPGGGPVQVGNSLPVTLAAAASASVPFNGLDASAAALVATTTDTYFATITQTAASGNGTVNYALINGTSCTAGE